MFSSNISSSDNNENTARYRHTAGSLVLAAFILLLNFFPVYAYEIPAQSSQFYVNDCAGLLSPETESYVISVNTELQEKTGAQVVVATVNDIDGASIEEYSTEMFRSYGIGDKDKDNGILMLLAYTEREVRIEVGYGLEGPLNDAKVGRLMDEYMIPYFKNDQWDEGMVNCFNAVIQEICTEYNIELSYNQPTVIEPASQPEEDDNSFYYMVAFGIISFIIGLISGKITPGRAFIPNTIWIIILIIIMMALAIQFWSSATIVMISFIAMIFGWGITSPDTGSSGGYSSGSRSSGGSYHSSSGGGHSGCGGSSGGGGASRRF